MFIYHVYESLDPRLLNSPSTPIPHPSPLTPHPSPLTPTPHPSPPTSHPSPLTPHLSPLTPHPPPLTPHPSPPTPYPPPPTPHPSPLTPHPRNRPADRKLSPCSGLKQAVYIFQAAESGEFTRISRQQLQYSNEKTSGHQIRSKASAKRCNYTRT